MAKIKGVWRSKWQIFDVGQNIYSGWMGNIEVKPFEKVTIYDGPNIDSRRKYIIFLSGKYNNLWAYERWLDNGEPKLVIVEKTGISPRELLEVSWDDKRGKRNKEIKVIKRFEPGEYDVKNNDFRNDEIEWVKVPNNSNVVLFDNSGQGGVYVPLSSGSFNLKQYQLDNRVSSFTYKLDEWEQISTRLGNPMERKDIGKPIVVSFKGFGPPGIEVECPVNLGNETVSEEEWHVSASITESVTIRIGSDASPVAAEIGVSSTQEAGGSNTKGNSSSNDAGIVVHAIADDTGQVKGNVIAQRFSVNYQIFRVLKNIRTGETTEQEGILPAQLYDFEFHFSNGAKLD